MTIHTDKGGVSYLTHLLLSLCYPIPENNSGYITNRVFSLMFRFLR